MSSPVICFSGRIGSGKTSVSRAVADAIAAAWTGFGDFVRDQATAMGLDPTSRDTLQELGAKLIRDRGIPWLCIQVIGRASWDQRRPLVIDGVRHAEVLNEVTSQVSGHDTILVHLAFDSLSYPARGGLDDESRLRAEDHSTERDVLTVLPSRANLIVSSSKPLDIVVDTVLAYLRERRYISA